MDNQTLQTALLDYFIIGKPVMKAAERLRDLKPPNIDDKAFRREIIKMKNSLAGLQLIHVVSGMGTNGTLYHTTDVGRAYAQLLQERKKV